MLIDHRRLRRNQMRRILIAIAALTLLAAACGGDDGEEATGPTEATGTTSATGPTATGPTADTGPTAATGPTTSGDCEDLTGEGEVFTITISNFAFVPDCFIASASQGISLVNEDPAPHNFSMTGTDVFVGPVPGGETFDGEPIAGIVEPGTYDFNCTIHPTMTGEVTVVA
jgi:plastocyanin